MKEAATTGQFDLRSKIGQKWQKYLKKNMGEAEAYKVLTMPEKRAKRAAFAKDQFSHVSASKQHVVTWREVDTKLGGYHTLGSLVKLRRMAVEARHCCCRAARPQVCSHGRQADQARQRLQRPPPILEAEHNLSVDQRQ